MKGIPFVCYGESILCFPNSRIYLLTKRLREPEMEGRECGRKLNFRDDRRYSSTKTKEQVFKKKDRYKKGANSNKGGEEGNGGAWLRKGETKESFVYPLDENFLNDRSFDQVNYEKYIFLWNTLVIIVTCNDDRSYYNNRSIRSTSFIDYNR